MKIALYKGTSFIDKCILFFSRGGYSHAAIILNNGTIIEAKPFSKIHRGKSIIDGLKNDTTIDIFEVKTNKKQDNIITEFLVNQLGKKYDYLDIFGFIVYATNEGRKKYNKWVCSELVMAAFKEAGINLLERVNVWKVSPTILSYSTKLVYKDTIHFKSK